MVYKEYDKRLSDRKHLRPRSAVKRNREVLRRKSFMHSVLHLSTKSFNVKHYVLSCDRKDRKSFMYARFRNKNGERERRREEGNRDRDGDGERRMEK